MQNIGFGVFVVGIAVAISGGAKLPESGAEWPTTVPMFLLGCLISVVGLVLWRRGVAQATAQSAAPGAGGSDAVALLGDLMEPARAFAAECGSMALGPLNARVDGLLSSYILPFAEVRQTLIHRFGMDEGAQILVTMAYGERMLNRAWSASADGHIQEARGCIPEALAAFEEAYAKAVSLS